jgi:hypothetical protein
MGNEKNTEKFGRDDLVNVDFVRELELAEHRRHDDGDVVGVDAPFDVAAVTFGKRMTRQLFDCQPNKKNASLKSDSCGRTTRFKLVRSIKA